MTERMIADFAERLREAPLSTTTADAPTPYDRDRQYRATVRSLVTIVDALLVDAQRRVTEDDTIVPALPEGWRDWAWRAVKGGTVGAFFALHAVEVAGIVLLWWMLRGQG